MHASQVNCNYNRRISKNNMHNLSPLRLNAYSVTGMELITNADVN